MKVAHLIPYLDFGGIEMHRSIIAKYWDYDDIELEYWVVIGCGRTYKSIVENKHMKEDQIVCINHPFRLERFPQIILDVMNLIRKRKVSLLHTASIGANIVGGIAAKLTGIPIIAEEVGIYPRKGLSLRLMRLFWEHVPSQIIAVSEATQEMLILQEKVEREKIIVLHNPYDVDRCGFRERFSQLSRVKSPDERIVVFVGRLYKEKNVKALIQAFVALQSDGERHIRLWIAGDGEERKSLEEYVRILKMQERVRFLGYIEDLSRVYRDAHLFVLPSHQEGLPISALEAVCNGVIPLLTNRGGAPEVLPPHLRGVLTFDPRIVDELREKMRWVLSLPYEEYVSLLGEIQEWVKRKFHPRKYVQRLRELYHMTLKGDMQ